MRSTGRRFRYKMSAMCLLQSCRAPSGACPGADPAGGER